MQTQIKEDQSAVNLLWTGGWDSTYRLIDLIHLKKVHVQPYYILDYERKSTFIELKTMQKLKEMIGEINKESQSRIHPLLIIPRFDINVTKDITGKLKKLKQERHLGNQYEWIGGFACQFGLDDLELCAEYEENPTGVQAFLCKNVIKKENERIGSYYILDDENRKTALSIFSNFRFPILDSSREQMTKNAKQFGFYDILKQTWFCHSPIGTNTCGVCPPCRQVVEKNMKYRLTRGALLRYRMRKYILWMNDKFGDAKLYVKFKRLVRNI